MARFRRGKKEIIVVGPGPVRQRGTWRFWLRRSLGVIFIGFLFVSGLRYDMRRSELRSARLDMEQIVTAARLFRQDFNRCPRDVDELAHPPAGGTPYVARPPRDPWGSAYTLGCPGRWNERHVDVASPGPDGEWLGGDDISTDL